MRKLIRTGVVVATVLAAFAPVMTAGPAQAANNTVVALTFDDGWDSQAVVPAMLADHGMNGTFYVNSGNTGQPGWLTWAQLAQFQAAGNEIGGNTLTHQDINLLTLDQARNEVCEDRGRLMKHGLAARSFSYPFGNYYANADVLDILQDCGYNSARNQWGIYDNKCLDGNGCGFPNAGALPPVDPFSVPTARNVDNTTTLAELKGYVERAEQSNGGLVPIVFHQICEGVLCDTYSTPQATLEEFLDWLEARPSGTIVRTMTQALGGTLKPSPGTADTTAPVSSILCDGTTCPAGLQVAPVEVNFSRADELDGSGVDWVRYTTDGSTPTILSPTFTAPFNVSVNTTIKYAAWDNAGNIEAVHTQSIWFTDTVAPVSTVKCNNASCGTGWFSAPVQISLAATDVGTGVDAIRYTTNGADPAGVSPLYTAPFPISGNTTLKYRAWDLANQAEVTKTLELKFEAVAPVATVKCNGTTCNNAWSHTAAKVALAATDEGGSGLASIRYTLNGSTPTKASAAYSAPITVSSTKTVTFRAYDNAGNAGAVKSVLVKADTVKPTVKITPANKAKVSGIVKITAKASDAGSGVARVYFYVNGKLKASDAKAPFTYSWNATHAAKKSHTITAKAIDVAGNRATKVITVTVK